jgi:beta-lactamase superfamily II metal-dependent hydrolase
MTFLKIPHHGSINNLSQELINIINPQIAYNSGNRYEDSEIIDCIKKKSTRVVRTTKFEGDLPFRFPI